ncbi:MAG: GTPase HflX [Acidobacteriota bacterium]
MKPQRPKERVLMVGVAPKGLPRAVAEDHLDELERLIDTAGGQVVRRFLKERVAPDPATFIGKGSVQEIGGVAREERSSLVVFDDELSPRQARNLEDAWGDGIRVIDRPGLILDVFALHARSREARTQVELAQLQYLLPRLAGRYEHLSRLGGGIGGRGAGEQKLELDRRKIRDRIARLRRDLQKIEVARLVRRRGRHRLAQVAVAGYTNAGKTTLFNRLTEESAFAADRLFATLDARAARAASPALSEVIFVDTVGFVRKLPTSLVASFRSTLAEIRDADLVLHVIDASSPRADEEEKIATETFTELGVPEDRILSVWTKADLAGNGGRPTSLRVSGKTGVGMPALIAAIRRRLKPETEEFRVRIPYTSSRAIAAARAAFRVLDEQDRGDGLWMRLAGERKHLQPLMRFMDAPGKREPS